MLPACCQTFLMSQARALPSALFAYSFFSWQARDLSSARPLVLQAQADLRALTAVAPGPAGPPPARRARALRELAAAVDMAAAHVELALGIGILYSPPSRGPLPQASAAGAGDWTGDEGGAGGYLQRALRLYEAAGRCAPVSACPSTARGRRRKRTILDRHE
jgi:hypothetical protein